jgi:hypothetical protein
MMRAPLSLALAGLLTVGGLVYAKNIPGPNDGSAAKADARSAKGCSFRNTEGLYGFNCTGFFPPTTPGSTSLQPIGFVGFVRGDGLGGFGGDATVSLDFGSLPARLDGQATLDPSRSCLGRVTYSTFEIEFAPGVWQNVGPATFDFVVVANGREILGSATAPAGTGIAVPRMACRLVKVHGD